MTVTERAALRQLYNFCCGYCGVSETDTVGHPLGVDESGAAHMTQDIYGKKFFPTPLNQCRGLSRT